MTDHDLAGLAAVADTALPGLTRSTIAGWTARLGLGVTARANSVFVHGRPPVDIRDAVNQIERWYGSHEARARFQLFPWSPAAVEDELALRAYRRREGALVQVAEGLTTSMVGDGAGLDVSIGDRPTDDWVSVHAASEQVTEQVSRAIITECGDAPKLYALARRGDRPVSCARVTLTRGWAGLSGVGTVSSERGRGWAAATVAATLEAAAHRGCVNSWLQVEPDNGPALALYERLGFESLDRYWYQEQTDSTAPDTVSNC